MSCIPLMFSNYMFNYMFNYHLLILPDGQTKQLYKIHVVTVIVSQCMAPSLVTLYLEPVCLIYFCFFSYSCSFAIGTL